MPEQIAATLIQALPYIRIFAGKTIVIKYGGNAMIDEELKKAVMRDLVLMRLVGINPILVHGGGPEINEAMKKLGKEPEFVAGRRVTDAETMEIVEMVLTGKTNKSIVAHLNGEGVQAVGLSGKDANLLIATKDTDNGDIGFVGKIAHVNPGDYPHAHQRRLHSRDLVGGGGRGWTGLQRQCRHGGGGAGGGAPCGEADPDDRCRGAL